MVDCTSGVHFAIGVDGRPTQTHPESGPTTQTHPRTTERGPAPSVHAERAGPERSSDSYSVTGHPTGRRRRLRRRVGGDRRTGVRRGRQRAAEEHDLAVLDLAHLGAPVATVLVAVVAEGHDAGP